MLHNFINIGKIIKTRGTNGILKVDILEPFEEEFDTMQFVFVEIDGDLVPYFIESKEYNGDYFIKFESIDNPEKAASLHQCPLLLREKDIKTNQYFERQNIIGLEGFTIVDNTHHIGSITAIQEYPNQLMAIVTSKDKEILIPLVEDWITEIDQGKKLVYMSLPEGLLDINISPD